jgi:signal transduction histidine kinase
MSSMLKKPKARVLLADDEPHIRDILEHELKLIDCEAIKCTNGKEAVEKSRELEPDLILLDVQMPVMNGRDACRAIRQDPRTRLIPILFVTSLMQTDQIVAGFEAGANDYITKPFNNLELRARVSTHLGLHRVVKEMAVAEKQRSLTTLTGGLCHELLNPLQLILGHLSILESDARLAAVQNRVAAMTRGALRIQKVLSALREYAKDTEESSEPVDLNAILENALELTRPMLDERKLDVKIELGQNLPRTSGVSRQLTQVFVQLLTNAAQYVPEGGRVEVVTGQTNGDVWGTVRDSGPGMTPKEQEQMFDPFFTNKQVWNSLGLGLSVAQRIVSDHGGKFEVVSAPGAGTEFKVLLPTA